MGELLLAIDQGTTGTTALVLDPSLRVRSRVNREFKQFLPRPGLVEHDLDEIWATTEACLARALAEAEVAGADVAAIGITNQRETTGLWSRATGRPLHRAIVWQDRRTAGRCQELVAAGHEPMVQERTGLLFDAYFSGTKIEWLLDHVEGARRLAEQGELAFGTIDTFLLWRLTGGAVHATEVSNASRTLLMNLREGRWDEELCALLRVPMQVLPELRPTVGHFGETRGVAGLPDGIPITGMAGDQQAALFGQACFDVGEAKCTYGTGAFLLMNIGAEPLPSRSRLLTTAAWQLGGEITYAFEGSAFIAGAAVQWLRDGLGLIRTAAEVEALAASVEDTHGVVFVPALTGLGAPHWNPDARGVLWGLTRGVTAGHVARAVLEGVAFQNYDILAAMQADLAEPLATLKVDGGACANDLLMQFQADLLGVPLVRPKVIETTALGAAMMAGLGAGIYHGFDELRGAWREDRVFEPSFGEAEREAHLARWREGLRRV
jgi:glycerol kinase